MESKHWVVALVDREYVTRINTDMGKYDEYDDISAIIPTVKILAKEFKGKKYFSEVPLLLNYGFIEFPESKIYPEFLELFKKRIPAIFGWLRDPCKRGKGLATVQYEEIQLILKYSDEMSIHSPEEVDTLVVGRTVSLKGYPFDDMDAIILSVNRSKRVARVELLLGDISKEVEVSFDNLLYTIYGGDYEDTPMKERSLDEMREKGRHNIDKLYARD